MKKSWVSKILLSSMVLSFASPVTANAADILMLTWRGETAAEVGFKEGLKELGVEANIETFDAERKRGNLSKYVRDNADAIKGKGLVYTFGTTTTKVVQEALKGEVAHVFNIVSDPAGAGIVDFLHAPGKKISGAKNTAALDVTFDVVGALKDYKKVAILFDPREENAVAQRSAAEAYLEGAGKESVAVRIVPDAGNFEKQLADLGDALEGADVVFVPAVSSFADKSKDIFAALPADVISVGAIGKYVGAGATLSVGADYNERGKAAAAIAKQVLDGVDAGTIPVNEVSRDKALIFANKALVEKMGLDVESVGLAVKYK